MNLKNTQNFGFNKDKLAKLQKEQFIQKKIYCDNTIYFILNDYGLEKEMSKILTFIETLDNISSDYKEKSLNDPNKTYNKEDLRQLLLKEYERLITIDNFIEYIKILLFKGFFLIIMLLVLWGVYTGINTLNSMKKEAHISYKSNFIEDIQKSIIDKKIVILKVDDYKKELFEEAYSLLIKNGYTPQNKIVLKNNYYFVIMEYINNKKPTDTYTKMIEKIKNQQMYDERAKKIKAQGDIILNKALTDTRKPE